jgi:hypothetical protein
VGCKRVEVKRAMRFSDAWLLLARCWWGNELLPLLAASTSQVPSRTSSSIQLTYVVPD